MLGTFQQSNLRIEIAASEQKISDSLLCPSQFQQWLFPQTFSPGMPERLDSGTLFTSWLGPVPIQHQVKTVSSNELQILMSKGVDGYQEWHWGEGWIQSRLAGVSALQLNLGQTVTLLRLKMFLTR
ncbi:MAG: hypothetical protein KME15_02110 [Drouetiella hepatica Uher 2000/2452]|jgi:hypothetical protein|uniref:Uncharacterized protein n=1 Tax=Drouetiella hepatica Uher 2000/2452 TaxID=904376 RepID=A0A951UKD3_9CYAN|nr:hypothetical protein [Drouetiella hepatica Uher 2000/2452]